MGEKRSYQTVEESNAKFDALIMQLRKRGELMLPPERQLCETLGCSRNTARKLLQLKVESGMVSKKRFGHTLSLETAANKKIIGGFSFIADGNSMIGNTAWAKLWARLQPMAEAAGICAELALIPYQKSFDVEAFERSLLNVAVVTTLESSTLPIAKSLKGKTLITTESHYSGIFKNVVALDNLKAGELAAKTLATHGYRKPAMISSRILMSDGLPYRQYEQRVEGFISGCRKFDMKFSDKSLLLAEGDCVRLMISIAKKAMELAKSDFDSVFLYTDVDLAFFMEGLEGEKVRVPEDIGVITLNSFDNAVRFNPPVTAVAHGTDQMAQTLVEKLKWIFETGETEFGECLVEPGVHEGRTLK